MTRTMRGAHARHDALSSHELFVLLTWSLIAGSVVGAAVETVYMYATFGVVENRTGLVIGWASPIYGVGAAVLTALAAIISGRLSMFIAAGVVGGCVETLSSLWMEWAFNASAWDYSGEFLSLAGHTDFTHCVFWGALGVVWAGSAVPVMRHMLDAFKAPERRKRLFFAFTAACLALYVLDAALTVAALDRWDERVRGVPADEAAALLDRAFPNELMERSFPSVRFSDAV